MTVAAENIPLIPRLQHDLDGARQRVAQLEQERGRLAFAVVDGTPDAEPAMVQWRLDMAGAREAVDDLSAALNTAIERDAAEKRARVARVRQTQVASIKSKLRTQAGAIARLGAAIENVSNAHADVITLAREIRLTCDAAGIVPPSWIALINPAMLKGLAAIELWRTNKTPMDSGGQYRAAFVGVDHAEAYRLNLTVEGMDDLKAGDPKQAIPLATRLDAQRQHLVAHIEGAPLPGRHFVGASEARLEKLMAVPERPSQSGPIAIEDFELPAGHPMRPDAEATRKAARTGRNPIPDDVELSGDARDNAILRTLDKAVAAVRRSRQPGAEGTVA